MGPITAASLFVEGLALHQAARLEEAEELYHQVLAMRPDHFDSLHLLGVIFHQRGNHAEAVRRINLALKHNSNHSPALNNRGLALMALGRFAEALASYDCALALQPDYAEAHSNRGNALQALGRFEEALTSYDHALALQPDYAEAHANRGNALHALKRFEEALACYDRALALRPDFAEFHCDRGKTLQKLRRFKDALASYDRALALRPDFADAHCNRGYPLRELKRVEEALASYDRALELRPDYADAHCDRGNVLQELRRFEDALASYDRALKVRPNFAEVHLNAALCRLLIGDFARGWQEYEWRWNTAEGKADKKIFPQPLWLGADDVVGKTILLYAEQGFGDTLQFCRYVPRVVERGARVILAVQDALHELMCTLPCAVQIVSDGEALPAFDLHCPLLSLPLAFGTRFETIPSQTPYLSVPENKRNAWRDRLGRHERPRIGLVWAGKERLNRQRSVQFDQLSPVLQMRGCEFYSLQKGAEAVAQLHNGALPHGVVDWSAEFYDFSDTAALIANLDLVISVDTAVAHLAGALGKRIWLLTRYNADWQWLLDREDSPWYPTARLFRQDATREWASVIARVAAALQDYVHNF